MAQITCPACAATYEVPASSLGAQGRKVRCAACKTLWLARAAAEAEPASSPAEAAAPEPVETAVLPPEASQSEILPPERAEAMPDVAMAEPRPRRRPWHQRVAPRAVAPVRRAPLVAGIALVACLGLLVGLRKTIVRLLPETGRAYAAVGLPVNLTGLELKQVRSGIFSEAGTELLVVQGEIVNVTNVTKTVPRLKFAIRDGKGQEIYSWTAQAETKDLKPGESQTFRRRLASPPLEGAEVLVRFAGKADLLAMAK